MVHCSTFTHTLYKFGSESLIRVGFLTFLSTAICVCLCTMFLFSPIFCTAVQIGFQHDSYTVLETDESVRVCVEMTTGNYTVPVTLAVLYTGSAQSMSH